ncbi:DgyrCDS4844 [Dimorphilus gyrociliatus]|uniref:Peroxin-19 n=1 Tax=Dimorphilus gyrociliatus TaxID=2664684 RepID=A0A7I8VIP2_9ANNE|nr:DgyrCDS4844 [Dimorphilus gyrociliatus]
MADDKNVTETKSENTAENKEPTLQKDVKNDADDLDKLLDSALGDFEETATEEKPKQDVSENDKQDKRPLEHFDPNAFASFFGGGDQNADFQAQMHDAMNQFLGPDHAKEMFAEFEKIAESTMGKEETPEGIPEGDFNAAISETLNNLEANTADLKNLNLSEDDVKGLLGNFNDSEMLQNMMKTLLSKDLLYPSLTELRDKYPSWLVENESKLSKEDKDRFKKQSDIVKQLVEIYDEEKESDSDEMKKQRFEKLMNLMQDMQSCGHPPKEIVGDVDPIDLSANQCSVM